MKLILILTISVFLIPLASEGMSGEVGKGRFTIFSPAFENRGTIPKKYGCEGDNVNPPLKMENIPSETKSMALIFDDQDAPRGSYVHWILWNIDPRTREIKENSFPQGAVQGMNDFRKNNYGGPCPPARPHRYVFNVFALDIVLNLNFNAAKPDLERAMEGHIISQAQLRGTYKRK